MSNDPDGSAGPEAGQLNLADLGRQTGEKPARVAELFLGLLRAGDQFDPADVERVRLIQLLERRGNDLATIARCHADQPDLLDRFITMLFPDGQYPNLSLPEAARRAGVDQELAQRLWTAAGMAGPGELLTSDDVDAIRLLAVAADAGFPEDALLQMVRVYSDSLSRVAEAEARLFHFCVHERLRDEGLTGEALVASTNRASDQLLGMVEPAVLYFHRKGMARAMRDDLVPPRRGSRTRTTRRPHRPAPRRRVVRRSRTVHVADRGDGRRHGNRRPEPVFRTRAPLSHRLRRTRRETDGDAFMLVFTNAPSALTCALDIRAAANAEPQFLGTRQGLHWGPSSTGKATTTAASSTSPPASWPKRPPINCSSAQSSAWRQVTPTASLSRRSVPDR